MTKECKICKINAHEFVACGIKTNNVTKKNKRESIEEQELIKEFFFSLYSLFLFYYFFIIVMSMRIKYQSTEAAIIHKK